MPLIPFAMTDEPGAEAVGYSGEKLVNCFPRKVGGTSQVALMARSGLVQWGGATGTTEPIRAIEDYDGYAFFVAGDKLYQSNDPITVEIGPLDAGHDSEPVWMAGGHQHLAFCTHGTYYVYDGTSITKPTPGVLTNVESLAYMDGYFILVGTYNGRSDCIQISGLDDATSFNALEFTYADEGEDAIVGVIRDHGDLYMFGTKTVQAYYNSGDTDFPFQPNRAAMLEHGCVNGKTLAKADSAVFWVRPDYAVVRSSGGTPQVISTFEVKEELERTRPSGGFTFSDRGSEFYAITRDAAPTLVYDIANGTWHRRTSGVDDDPWIVTCATRRNFDGGTVFGTDQGFVVKQDASVFQDVGEDFAVEAVSRPLENGGEPIRIGKVHLNLRGSAPDIGRTPRVMLQSSKDGVIWGVERWRNMATHGTYWRRSVWHGFGWSRRMQFRIRMTDPVGRDIYGVQYG